MRPCRRSALRFLAAASAAAFFSRRALSLASFAAFFLAASEAAFFLAASAAAFFLAASAAALFWADP